MLQYLPIGLVIKLKSNFVLQFTDSMLNWSGREVQGAGKVQSQAAHVHQVTQISFSSSVFLFPKTKKMLRFTGSVVIEFFFFFLTLDNMNKRLIQGVRE